MVCAGRFDYAGSVGVLASLSMTVKQKERKKRISAANMPMHAFFPQTQCVISPEGRHLLKPLQAFHFTLLKPGIFLLFFFLFFPVTVSFAQQAPKRIEITRYNSLEFNSQIVPDAQRVIGNVEFQHEGMTMTCDSAYLYTGQNTLDAFSRVHLTNAERSVTIDGEFAKYQGNIKFAEIWKNVVLVDSNAVLKTQHLYYDLNTNIAYYLNGGEIYNKGNDMMSKRGHYHRNINTFYFKTDVVLNTPDYTIVTDTMDYNVESKISNFLGPTFIQNEKDTIFCERGWYDTNDTIALFRRNAWIKNGSTTINGDTLYYESKSGNGQGFGNVIIVDTTNNIILKGQKGAFHQPTEHAWLTGHRALLIMAGEKDSLYVHADTLRSDVDTSGFKIMSAYNRVRFFSADMQGKCDSLTILLKDTVIHMFRLPILWAQDNQMTADHIEIETKNQKPKQMNLNNKGFIAQEDPSGFNQIKGRKIVGLFRDDELYRVNGFEDAETLYFFYDGPDVTGVNKMKSKDVVILIEDRQAQEVTHKTNVEAETIPPNEFNQEELTLSGFKWQISLKPVDRNDIYEWKEEEPAQKTATTDTNTKEKPGNTTPAPGNTGERKPLQR